ncbi:hypothetical protein HKX48_004138 [Thoreauomyces humboldtii]|nr:hypothetical protein HKX48_004138 [Thoreauomyces humboldtii]
MRYLPTILLVCVVTLLQAQDVSSLAVRRLSNPRTAKVRIVPQSSIETRSDTAPVVCVSTLYPAKNTHTTYANCTLSYEQTRDDCESGDSSCTLLAEDRLTTCQNLCISKDPSVLSCAKACAKNWQRFEKDVCRPLGETTPVYGACEKVQQSQLEGCQDICVKLHSSTSASAPAPSSSSTGGSSSTSSSSTGNGSTDSIDGTRTSGFDDSGA